MAQSSSSNKTAVTASTRRQTTAILTALAMAGLVSIACTSGIDKSCEQGLAINNQLEDNLRAIESCRQALEIYRETGDRPRQAHTLYHIGGIYRYQLQDFPLALEAYQQALVIYQEVGDRNGEAQCRSRIKEVEARL